MAAIQLTDQQLAAIAMVRDNKLSLLTGKPGTGKTTATLEIINWAESAGLKILLAAPTGKAAKRMIEATGRYASTIHYMLECIFMDGEFFFIHNQDNPLIADLVIIDEVSMVTNQLMADLLRAISPSTKILLVGDSGQLPSVGAGAVLRDLIAIPSIPHTELDIIHRNSGSIVEACAAIHAGLPFSPAKRLALEAESPQNLVHVECATPEKTAVGIRAMVCERMPLRGYDPIWDVQVISPVNSRGGLSCDALNEMLQAELNPLPADSLHPADIKLRPGDKVINTKNENADGIESSEKLAIVNGDIGRVVELINGNRDMVIDFFDPARRVKIPVKKNNLLLAYAVTCHRMQGSEAPVVIIPVHRSFGFFVNRSWIYTAISRARQICITVGNFAAVEGMIANNKSHYRITKLADRIKEELEFAEI